MNSNSNHDEPIVAFVGAGGSALSPSFLPTWKNFNNLLLEALCQRLGEYSRNREPVDRMLGHFRARRDATAFFPPDFQAQLMEEEIGAEYFRVWQSLESDVYGPVHAGLAALASKRRVAAIITLNFDRLFEKALEASGQAFEVYHDAAGFSRLLSKLGENPDAGAPLPIIKLHGSLEDTASLVDTLRQRVVGRPTDVDAILNLLLRKHRWVFLGFSGADWNYDSHYLGILDAAEVAKGFDFLAFDPENVEEGVHEVVKAYGPGKASIVGGDLNTWIPQRFQIPPPDLPASSQTREDVLQRVSEGITRWVEQLGPMSVVNIVCSMLKSAGLESHAYQLLRGTWKRYRAPSDTSGPSYDRFNFNYGMSLLEAGQIRNPIVRADDLSNIIEWKKYADQNAVEFLARSFDSSKSNATGAMLAAVLAYRGEVGRALALLSDVTDKAIAAREKAPLDLCDVALAATVLYDLLQFYGPPAAQLHGCLQLTKAAGDEPRRALMSAHLGRLLTCGGEYTAADSFLKEAETVARRLEHSTLLVETRAARGRWLAESRTSLESAIQVLRSLADELREADDVPRVKTYDLAAPDNAPTEITAVNPRRCRVLLDLNRAAMMNGDAELMNHTLDQLDVITTGHLYLGYHPHYCIAYAQCLLSHGDEEQKALAIKLLAQARQVGDDSQNPWPRQMAERIAAAAKIALPPESKSA